MQIVRVFFLGLALTGLGLAVGAALESGASESASAPTAADPGPPNVETASFAVG